MCVRAEGSCSALEPVVLPGLLWTEPSMLVLMLDCAKQLIRVNLRAAAPTLTFQVEPGHTAPAPHIRELFLLKPY